MSEAIAMPAKLPTGIFQTGHHWLEYQHVARNGESPDVIADPRYWQHVAYMLKARDVISIVSLDNTFEMRLRVVDATKGALKLRVIAFIGDELTDEPLPAPAAGEGESPFRVSFSNADKWRVIDKATDEVVSKDHATRKAAEQVADNLVAARKAA